MLTSTRLRALVAVILLALAARTTGAQVAKDGDYVLGAGDVLRVTVYQNPGLTTEVRVSESGTLSLPLVGRVTVAGLTLSQTEQKVADLLREGAFVPKPQVNILPLQVRSSQVAVLGQVNRPGRYPLETGSVHVSDMLAVAGGILPSGADGVVWTGTRDGAVQRREIDIPALVAGADRLSDLTLQGGDVLYVNRAPVFYIYGEVQRAGAFRLERNMSIMQGLATGGGLTARGTEKGIRVHRRGADGKLQIIEGKLDEPLEPNDVIYVREGLF